MDKISRAHIAVVDDDAMVRESLCDCMESAGYSVEGFASAEDFLESKSDHADCLILDIACLILDIQLPGETGLELQRRIGNGAGPPIIFVTANATEANRETALKLGAKGFLAKPVRCQDLVNAVKAATSA